MHITIFGMHYSPEPSGNAPYTTGLARGLARRGHRVSVVTGTPHYPDWRIFDGYGHWARTTVEDEVTVTRLRHPVWLAPNAARRLSMETAYGARAALRSASESDIHLYVSPSLFGTAILRTRQAIIGPRVPAVLWIQDLYSKGIAETGGPSRSASLVRSFERAVVRRFDRVAVAHGRFGNTVKDDFGVDSERIRTIRNWQHLESSRIDRETGRSSFSWGEREIVCLHAGNMGTKQGLDNVVEAARVAEAAHHDLRFVFVGGGHQEASLRELARGLTNVSFLGSLADEQYVQALKAADILLVNEKVGVREMSIPSKLGSYFASGRPVLAATDEASVTAAEVIASGAGLVVPAGQPEALVSGLRTLSSDSERMTALGDTGRQYAIDNLSETAAIDSFEDLLGAASEKPLALRSENDVRRRIRSGQTERQRRVSERSAGRTSTK